MQAVFGNRAAVHPAPPGGPPPEPAEPAVAVAARDERAQGTAPLRDRPVRICSPEALRAGLGGTAGATVFGLGFAFFAAMGGAGTAVIVGAGIVAGAVGGSLSAYAAAVPNPCARQDNLV